MKMELTRYKKRLLRYELGIYRSRTLALVIFILSALVLLAQLLEVQAFEGSSMTLPIAILFLSVFSYSYHYAQAQHLKRLQNLE
ncbi:hypothetical protein SAMN02745166_01973 [Prosthecobacter debontii]|uniref:Uncharacterized protein n=1 Tax=Prosthecobacter debontii TaxID=48467 RepID=A0A1T4XTH2_9BACT|nr:hypothetical protein SAMN02745166_01973 [Prosthecobacter debontii]